MLIRRFYLLSLFLGLVNTANATTDTFSGYLNDAGNSALVASDLTTALFDTPADMVNNVAIYDFTVLTAGTVTFESQGFALGGIDPYFTLFEGTGNSAVFNNQSNYTQAFSTGGDFSLSYSLAAGHYELALSSFANMSFAENNPTTGTLQDGFTGLGSDSGTTNPYYYQLAVTGDVFTVPEPSSLLLFGFGLLGIATRKLRS
ncbi:DVUA0089 family protein [Methylomonas sp. AM2-LC]|uniref:DVUA0089 family protein n=1 Tax=Methylomonas sp. AM2-LC TaxID=3153301 RepID=UPI003262E9B1